jgi:hypothetical protein
VKQPKELSAFMAALRKQIHSLRSLTIGIREPVELRHQSMKKHFEWHQQTFFSHQHLKQLLPSQDTNTTAAAAISPSKLEHLSFEPWGITSESLQWCAASFPNLKSLRVSNPVVSQPDGYFTGGIDFEADDNKSALGCFRNLQRLHLSPILNFEFFFQTFRESNLIHSLREMVLDFRCIPEEWELRELQQHCKHIERVSLTYFALSMEFGQVGCEWQRGRVVVPRY